MDTLGLGIIGLGSMGQQHFANALGYAAGVEVRGLQDLDAPKAQGLAARCGAQAFASPEDLIASPRIDAVLIAAPDALHPRLALACLRAKKPCLCEKPLATQPREALAILEAEVALGRLTLSLGFQRRFDPCHLGVKEAASSGRLGRPLLWKGVHRNLKAPYDSRGAVFLVNSAGHDIDSARWLLDAEVAEIEVRGLRSRESLSPESQDLLLLSLLMADGRLATAEVYMNCGYGYEVEAELVCQDGVATSRQPATATLRSASLRGEAVAPDWTLPFQEAYRAELLAWLDSAKTYGAQGEGYRSFPGASAWDGYVAMATSAAGIASLTEGGSRRVDLIQQPALYRRTSGQGPRA